MCVNNDHTFPNVVHLKTKYHLNNYVRQNAQYRVLSCCCCGWLYVCLLPTGRLLVIGSYYLLADDDDIAMADLKIMFLTLS